MAAESTTDSGMVDEKRWDDMLKILNRPGPMSPPDFEPCVGNLVGIGGVKLLVVGAGGLGCELLKDLAMSGFRKISVIDCDTIDVSNLNRQFLFRKSDVGKSKAEAAAAFIEKRVPGCKVTPYDCRIEEKDKSFYLGFNIVICGLDSVSARRWLNSMIVDCLEYDDNNEVDRSTIIPIIDGGTEGFKGNARVIFPGMNPCIECTLSLYPPQINFPMCTIAHTPRLPEHCIEWAKLIAWDAEKPFQDEPVDGDNPDHIQWLFEKSKGRSREFGISGVTHRLTMGVVKRIIPAVASTNAVIAASCVMEVIKIATFVAPYLDNYLNFQQVDSVSASTVQLERREDCPVCSNVRQRLTFTEENKLQDVVDFLVESPNLQMKSPSITSPHPSFRVLYMTAGNLEEKTRPNLKKTLKELELNDGSEIGVADPTRPITQTFRLTISAPPMDENS